MLNQSQLNIREQVISVELTNRHTDLEDRQRMVQQQTNNETIRPHRLQKRKSFTAQNILSALKIRNMTRRFVDTLKYLSAKTYGNIEIGRKAIIAELLEERFGKQNSKDMIQLRLLDIDSWVTVVWDSLFFLINCSTLVWLPFQLSFSVQDAQSQSICEIFIVISQLLEQIFYLNRVHVRKGKIVRDRRQIMKIYIKEQFYVDLSQIVFLLIGRFVDNKLIQLLAYGLFLLIRFSRIHKLFDTFIEYFNISNQAQDILTLFNMFMFVSYVVHFIACIWHGVGRFAEQEVSWISFYKLEHSSMIERYSVSFYWSAMTVTTVGYGDITPKNVYEYLCADITMIVVCIVFGYTLNSIGNLISNIQQREQQFKKNYIILNRYMKRNRVNTELQFKIRSYMEYLRISELKNDDQKAEKIVQKLSPSLQQELRKNVFLYLMRKVEIFKQFSKPIQEMSSEIVETVDYLPEQFIEIPQDPNDLGLIILQKGKVKEILPCPKAESIYPLYLSGQVIGSQSFFSQTPSFTQYLCLDFTTLLRIPLKKFKNLIQPEGDSDQVSITQEKLQLIKDRILMGHKYNHFTQPCALCKQKDHCTKDCTSLKLSIDKESIIKKHLLTQPQPRARFLRRHQKSNSLRGPLLGTIRKQLRTLSSKIVDRGSHFSINERDEDVLDSDDEKPRHLFFPRKIINHKSSIETDYARDEIPYELKDTLPQTNCEDSVSMTEYHSHSQAVNNFEDNMFSLVEMDQLYAFKEYFPQHNYDKVILQISRLKDKDNLHIFTPSIYTFDQNLVGLFTRIKQKLHKKRLVL